MPERPSRRMTVRLGTVMVAVVIVAMAAALFVYARRAAHLHVEVQRLRAEIEYERANAAQQRANAAQQNANATVQSAIAARAQDELARLKAGLDPTQR
jgi:hypothetical protein